MWYPYYNIFSSKMQRDCSPPIAFAFHFHTSFGLVSFFYLKHTMSDTRIFFPLFFLFFASGGQGVLFCQRCQVQVTGAGEKLENDIKKEAKFNRSPMPWGPLDPRKNFLLIVVCVCLVSVRGKNYFNENCITVGRWSALSMLGTKTLINWILSWV